MRHKDDSKRVAISNAAIELITTIGFAETSMSKIAKAAKVSPATIYVYFENKEDILISLFENQMKVVLDNMKSEISKEKESVKKIKRFQLMNIANLIDTVSSYITIWQVQQK